MQIWSVANQKGGVGKTTTAVTLAGLLHDQKQRVLLVDLDPHGSMTSYFGEDPDEVGHSAYDLFQATASGRAIQLQTVICQTSLSHIDLLPASTALATLDRQLGTREGMGLVLKRGLRQIDSQYAYCIIDCPPMLGLLMVNALAACRHVVIPVQTEFLAIKGLDRMLHTLRMLQRSSGKSMAYTVVPTFFDRRTRASIDARRRMHAHYRDHLWDSVIPVDTQFREASRQGKPLSAINPRARGVLAYSHLLSCLPTHTGDQA